jgi:shikimate kinase
MTPSALRPSVTRLVCLTGFMGAGKTTVGSLLARQLAWRFEDLDTHIENYTGMAIPAIFERLGEPAFRQIESEQLEVALARAAESQEALVLALGGGTYAQPGMVERLQAAGAVVIWIDCPVEQLLARCATMTNRPLFRDEPSFRQLLAARLPFYEQANHRIAAGDDPAKIVEYILALPPFGRWLGVGEECTSQRVKP